jgi:pimeloyl-ACP methyl ester carboxylesterase
MKDEGITLLGRATPVLSKRIPGVRACARLFAAACVASCTTRGPVMPVAKRITLTNGLTLSYVDQGNRSAFALVLLPGLSDSWRSYARVLPHVPASIRVIAVSPRGHGDSDKPQSGYRTKDFSADVADLLSRLGVTRAIVAGHSSASLVAQRFAIDYPERTGGIVLEGSFATLRGRRDLEDIVKSTIDPLVDPISRDFVRTFAAGTIVRPVPPSFMDSMVGESLKMPARVWREAFAGLLLDDHTLELGHITAPTILIWGDQDGLIRREQQDALTTSIPRSRLFVYSGIGHTPHWEDPERFATDVIAFVNSIQQGQ